MDPDNTLQNAGSFIVIVPVNGTAGDADYNSGAIVQPITIPAGSGNGTVLLGSFVPTTDNPDLKRDESLAQRSLSVQSGAATVAGFASARKRFLFKTAIRSDVPGQR